MAESADASAEDEHRNVKCPKCDRVQSATHKKCSNCGHDLSGARKAKFAQEARADEKSKYDEMEEDELRRAIAKLKGMGEKAPAGPMIKANQALARKLAESWEHFDAMRNAGHFSHNVKTGPMPGSVKDSPGRGPHGEIRNFKAMGTGKLTETLKALAVHGEDPEAHIAAMTAAADKLGVKFGPDGVIKMPSDLIPTG